MGGCSCDGYTYIPCTCDNRCYGYGCACNMTCYGYVTAVHYRVQIDGAGTPDTFKYSIDGGSTWVETLVPITGEFQELSYGVKIKFDLTTGHTSGNYWDFYAGDGIYIGERLIHYYQNYGGNNLVYHSFHPGTDEQDVDSQLQFEIPEWDETMRNTAYSYFRLTYNVDAWKQLSDFTIVAKGRSLFDPRNGATIFSRNPALVWLDIITAVRYGLGIPQANVDLDSIKEVANWCDTNNYYFDGIILDRMAFGDHLDQIMMNFRAFAVWSEGIYRLKVFTDDAAVMSLTEDDVEISPESFKIEVPGIPETPSAVKTTFADKEEFYTANFAFDQDVSHISLVGDMEIFEMSLIGTTAMAQAKKIAKYARLRNQLNKEYPIVGHPRCYALEPGDTIYLTHSYPNWNNKKLRVKTISYLRDGLVPMSLIEEDTSLYA